MATLRQGQVKNKVMKLKWARKNKNSLLWRLEKYRDSHLPFLRRFDVLFDNSMSKRDLRMVKKRPIVSGGIWDESCCDIAHHPQLQQSLQASQLSPLSGNLRCSQYERTVGMVNSNFFRSD